MFNLESAIAMWRRQMSAGGFVPPEVLNELESHLLDDVEQQTLSGSSPEQAFAAATIRLGQVEILQAEFEKAYAANQERRRKGIWFAGVVGAAFFMIGACLCYFFIVPLAWRAAGQYESWLGISAGSPSPNGDWFFQCRLILVFALGLAVPGGLLALLKAGCLDQRKLTSFRGRVVLINLILAALLTTPEVLTQIMMFVPLQAIYEGIVWISGVRERRQNKQA